MANNETLEDILKRTVRDWIKNGTIIREQAAFLHAERISHGKITRGSFRAFYQGRRVPQQDRVFEALEEVTGVSRGRLVSAAQRWEPPEEKSEDVRDLEVRVEDLEAELNRALRLLEGHRTRDDKRGTGESESNEGVTER